MRKLPSELSLGLLLGMMAMNKSSLWVLALVLHAGLSHAGYHSTSPVKSKHGYVMARAQVLDESGQPILVEYDSSGKEVRALSLPIPTNQAILLPAAEYRQQQAQLDQYRQQHKDDLAKDALLLSSAQYAGMTFLAADNKTTIPAPPLPASVRSVLVRGQGNRLLASSAQLILLPFSVDLSQGLTIGDQITTLVMDRQGKLLDQVKGTVAPRSGFVADSNGKVLAQDMGQFQGSNATPIGPIRDAIVNTGDAFPGAGVSNEKGRYSFTFVLPPCPVGGFEFTTDVWLKMSYQSFTPRGGAILPYYMRLPGYDSCYASLHNPTSLVSAMAEVSDIATIATLSNVSYESNFYVDVMFLSGQVSLANPDGKSIPVADSTSYRMDPANADPVTQNYYDFDGDNKPDASVLGNIKTVKGDDDVEREAFVSKLEPGEKAKYQGVYFSSRSDKSGAPDLLRLADSKQNKNSNGLLASISKSDLQNTDILVFRESTGELVLSRQGVTNAELSGLLRDTGINGKNDHFYYRLMLRGPADLNWNMGGSGDRSGSWQQWASSNNMTEPYQKKAANHLKSGERVKVVAINRATGYMASQSVQLKDSSSLGSGLLSLAVPDMVLMPPNLKIWAERDYKVEEGMTQGEQRHYLIGSEGASLTSDNAITVYTEWLDQDGRPLPAGLAADNGEQYGLTGRLAKVVAPDLLQAVSDGQLASFPIPPGRSTQIVQIADNLTKPEHYYVHVAGTPKDNNPQFDAGSASAPLNSRPAKLTPFLTPFYDEDLSWVEFNAYRQLQSSYEQADDQSQLIKPIKPKSSYQWTYRPEYQFSRYQLEMNKLTVDADENGGTRVENLLDVKQPTLSSLDDLLTLFYSLNGPANPRLQSLDAGQDLVFALGESELSANIKSDGTIRFDKASLEHLSALQPEDFLSLKLYSNQDAGNVLWEYAFEYLSVMTRREGFDDTDDQGVTYVSADDPVVPLQAMVIGYADRDPKYKQPLRVSWNTNFGYFTNLSQEYKDLGIYPADLRLPAMAGVRADVSVQLGDSENSRFKLQPFVVIPGKPAKMTPEVKGQDIYITGHKSVELTVDVRDAYGNAVADGTPVEFSLDGEATFERQDLATKAGRATAIIRGHAMPSAENSLIVKVAGFSYTHKFAIKPLHVVYESMPIQFEEQQRVPIAVKVTDDEGELVAGVPVRFNANFGKFADSTATTGQDGIATSMLHTGFSPGKSADIMARVGMVPATFAHPKITAKDKQLDMKLATLIGDVSQAGQADYERFDGLKMKLAYEAQTDVELLTPAEQTSTLTLGTLAEPNLMPLAAYYMNELVEDAEGEQEAQDETSLHSGAAHFVTLLKDDPTGTGTSYRFTPQGYIDDIGNAFPAYISVPNNEALRPEDGLGFRVDVRPEVAGGTILKIGGAQSLTLDSDGRLNWEVYTDTGPVHVTSQPLAMRQWHTVAGRYYQGTLELEVDGQALPPQRGGQTLSYSVSGSGLEIGRGLTGALNSLRLYDYRSAPLLSFADGSQQLALQGTGHSQKVAIKSLGQLNQTQAGSQLRMLKVGLQAQHSGAGQAQSHLHYVGVLSKDFFALMMGQYYEAHQNDGMPPIDITRLDYQGLPLIPMAYAGWGDWVIDGAFEAAKMVLGAIIPYEDFVGLWNQMNYWIDGDSRFDPLELAFNAMGVITVVPVLKPLKVILIPLKRVLIPLRKSKFIRSMGGIIGDLADDAMDGKFDKLIDMMPMLITAYEMATDEEARQGLMTMVDAISSADDFFVWVDFLRLPANGWDGDSIPKLDLQASHRSSSLSFGGLINEAYAGRNYKLREKVKGEKIGTLVTKLKHEVLEGDADAGKKLTETIRTVTKSLKDPKADKKNRFAIFNETFLKGVTGTVRHAGAKNLENILLADKSVIRMPIIVPIGAIAYLESRMNHDVCEEIAGCKEITDADLKKDIRVKYATAFSPFLSGEKDHMNGPNEKGAIFHLVMIAVKQIEYEIFAPSVGKIIAIEENHPIQLYKMVAKEATKAGSSIDRNVDIVVANPDKDKKPIWVEVKSLKAPFNDYYWRPWSFNVKNQSSYGRQWILDRIATTDNSLLEGNLREENHQASEFEWWLQAFKRKTKDGKGVHSYDTADWKRLRKALTPSLNKTKDDEIMTSLGFKRPIENYPFVKSVNAGCRIKSFSFLTFMAKSPSIKQALFNNIADELFEMFFEDELEMEVDLSC